MATAKRRQSTSSDNPYARFNSDLIPSGDAKKGNVAIIGIPFEGRTNGPAGARGGPAAIREALSRLRGFSVDLEVDTKEVGVTDLGDVPIEPLNYEATFASIDQTLSNALGRGLIPFILGGSHSITEGTVKAFSRFHRGKKIGLFWLDAHADTFPGPFRGDAHYCACPLNRLIEDGAVRADKVAVIGLRGFGVSRAAYARAKELGIKIIKMDDVFRMGLEKALDDAIKVVKEGTDLFYSTLDIDAGEGATVPGTQAPEPNGFTHREMCLIARRVGMEGASAFDLVEVAPPLDSGNMSPMTSRLAATMVLEAIAGRAHALRKKNRGAPQ